MGNQTPRTLVEHFSQLTFPRIERTKRHKLIDILLISICATICGAEGWAEFDLFGQSKLDWFKSFLELPNRIPSDDTFGRVISRIDSRQFQQCFLDWLSSVYELTQGHVVAVGAG